MRNFSNSKLPKFFLFAFFLLPWKFRNYKQIFLHFDVQKYGRISNYGGIGVKTLFIPQQNNLMFHSLGINDSSFLF